MKKILLFFAVMMMAITASAKVYEVSFEKSENINIRNGQSKVINGVKITCLAGNINPAASWEPQTKGHKWRGECTENDFQISTENGETITNIEITTEEESRWSIRDLYGTGWTKIAKGISWTGSATSVNVGGEFDQVIKLTVTVDETTAHTHNYATTWSSDETNHWHACTGEGECDAPKADEAAHSYGEVATETAYYTCSVCQYENITRKAEYEAAVEVAKYATLTYNVADQGGLGVKVKKGEVTLNVTAEEDWAVATLTVNSEDKLADLAEGKLTFDMQDDATVAVTYKWADEENLYTESDITTGIITTKADVKAYVKDGQICVESNGAAITLYTINGAKIAQKTPAMKTAIFTVPEGTYIVKVGNEGIKLVVE